MKNFRRKKWIDPLQTKLGLYIAFYFGLYHIAVWMLVSIERRVTGSLEAILGVNDLGWPLLLVVVMVALGAVFVLEAVRVSHRVVGPLYRFRKALKAIKAGEPVPLITLRQGDYLQDMKDDLNDVLKLLQAHGAIQLKQGGATAS